MSALFVLQTPLPELILRAAVIYFFLLLVMRVIGRHEFGQLTPFDLILLLIIFESISEAITAGDDSLLAGLVSASTLLSLSRCSSPSGSTKAGGSAASSPRTRSR